MIYLEEKNGATENSEIAEFTKSAWKDADLEHYGRSDIDFTKKEYTLVAKNEDNKIMGILYFEIEVNVCFVDTLLVGKKFQNNGIGTKLLDYAEKFAKEKKCTKIYLETNEGWDAVKFYKKRGYKNTGMHEKHILGQNSLFFTKFLK